VAVRVRPSRVTESALADAIDSSLGGLIAVLEESKAMGIVERCGPNRWRLTEYAERKYGRALGDLRFLGDAEEETA
jgi:hypothetical protein